MKNIIKSISSPINMELREFNVFFKDSLNSKVSVINTVINYIIKNKGKQFRPILCLLCSRLNNGEPNKITYLSASTVEILHVATLLHDDVVDDAVLRRGWPSINRIWKNKLSILVGDFMFSRALINITKHNKMESINILGEISERLSEGEILQMEKAISKNMDEKTYFKMIADKTASLISASCFLGFASTNSDDELKKSIKKFGEYLGIAFQLKDDLMDILGSIDETGKKASLDLKRNMLTLPYLYILSKIGKKERNNLISKLKYCIKKEDLVNLKKIINDYGGIEYTELKIHEYSELALRELSKFEDSIYKEALKNAVNYNKERLK